MDPVQDASEAVAPSIVEPVPPGTVRPRRSRSEWLVLAYVVAITSYVVLCIHQPMQFNSFADKDDGYFIAAAQSMLDGRWLGDYTQMTLIKGPGFAYFLAANHLLGLSITVSLTVFFVVSCALLVRVVGRCLPLPRVVVLVLFVGLLFQPALMPSRVLRDHLYHSLFLLVLAGMITLTMDRRPRRRVVRCFLWGLPIGFFWITREEGIWVLPAVVALVAVWFWQARRSPRASLLPLAGATIAMLIGAALPVVTTSAINQHVYGTFTVTDINAAPFQGALRMLDSISVGNEVQRVPVSRRALAEAYAASPAMAELRGNLSSPDNFWLGPGCDQYPTTCGEFAGGWFGWAIRDAAAEAGHYSSATEASRFFSQVTRELASACDAGELRCDAGVVPFGPVVSVGTLSKLPGTLWSAARLTTYGPGATPPVLTTVGEVGDVERIRQFLGNPRITAPVVGPAVDAPENAGGWVRAKEAVADVYAVIMPVVALLGAVTFWLGVILLVTRRPVDRRLLAVAGVCWMLYVSRLGLISLIDITSSPAIIAEYLEPAFLAVWVAAVMSIAAVTPWARELRTSRKREPGRRARRA